MRHRTLVLLGLLTALVVGEIGMRLLGSSVPPSSNWPTAEMQLKSDQIRALDYDPDIVLIGSSTSQSSIDPELLEQLTGREGVYNAALPFATFVSNAVWLDEVVLAHTSPHVVIIGVSPWAADEDGTRVSEVMQDALADGQSWLNRSNLISNRGLLADFDSRRARQRLIESGLWTRTGHFTGYYGRGPIPDREWSPPSRAGELTSENEAALLRMVNRAWSVGAQPIILVEPVCCRTEGPHGNASYLRWLKSRANDWGVPFWDTYSENWGAELFADPSHLNRDGTEAYTAFVAGLLTNQMLRAGNSGT